MIAYTIGAYVEHNYTVRQFVFFFNNCKYLLIVNCKSPPLEEPAIDILVIQCADNKSGALTVLILWIL